MKRTLVMLLVIVMAGFQTPAHSASKSFTDPKGDVRHKHDIHWVTVNYGKQLVIKVKFRDIVPGGLTVFLDTGARNVPNRMWGSGVGGDTDWQVWRTDGWRTKGMPMGCWSQMRRNSDTNVLTAKISQACLGKSRRVRVSAESVVCGWFSCSAKDYAPARHRYYPWVSRG